jgi:hypothetical protein
LFCALTLVACGGGGSSAVSSPPTGIDLPSQVSAVSAN